MRERGSSPLERAKPEQVIWLDPSQVDTNQSLKQLMRDGKVWIITPKAHDETALVGEMITASGPCKEST